jgi:phosphate transport system substrate-binding protein
MHRTLPVLIGVTSFLHATTSAQVSINAAGATFPATIYQRWGQEFKEARINYQSVGSGAGINQLTQGTVDFGASDMPMTDEQMSKLSAKPLHFPTVLGAVVPVYNIPGVTAELKFTPDTLAGIYIGDIHKWNDPRLTIDNPEAHLPDADILTVHRSDGSGTTYVWCDYLAKVSNWWKSKIGGHCATALRWPASGLAGKGNEGVAGMIRETPNTIGYVELVYATKQRLTFGSIRNYSGKFVKASLESVTAAASGAAGNMPDDFRVSITNPGGADSYPICSFTYLLIPSQIPDPAKKKAIVEFLGWMLTTGQNDAPDLDFAPLPAAVVAREQQQIALIH